MRACDIQNWLMRFVHSGAAEIVVPNYYLGRYECDVMKVSKSHQVTEYEIKVSRADFKKDAEKAQRDWRNQNIISTKHADILAEKRCNRFYFVVPKGLVTVDEVPEGLGLIYAHQPSGYNFIQFEFAKMSKLFKAPKADIHLYRHLACNLTYKISNARFKAQKSKDELTKLKLTK